MRFRYNKPFKPLNSINRVKSQKAYSTNGQNAVRPVQKIDLFNSVTKKLMS